MTENYGGQSVQTRSSTAAPCNGLVSFAVILVNEVWLQIIGGLTVSYDPPAHTEQAPSICTQSKELERVHVSPTDRDNETL